MKTVTHRVEALPDRSERPAPPAPPRRRTTLFVLLVVVALLVAAVIVEELRIRSREDAIATMAPANALVGAPLADGPHDVRIFMVGAQQSPPMIAVDDEAIFTEDDAVGAAIEDGMAPAEARGLYANEYAYYFRNTDPGWSVMPVAPAATIILQSWRPVQGNLHTEQISLEQFGRIYNGTAAATHHFRWQHYEIVVQDGLVVRIQELNLMQ
jgi:hypothetical protein